MEAIEIIGTIIMCSIILGIIGTTIWVLIIISRADPDCEDNNDVGIHEHNYWDENKK